MGGVARSASAEVVRRIAAEQAIAPTSARGVHTSSSQQLLLRRGCARCCLARPRSAAKPSAHRTATPRRALERCAARRRGPCPPPANCANSRRKLPAAASSRRPARHPTGCAATRPRPRVPDLDYERTNAEGAAPLGANHPVVIQEIAPAPHPRCARRSTRLAPHARPRRSRVRADSTRARTSRRARRPTSAASPRARRGAAAARRRGTSDHASRSKGARRRARAPDKRMRDSAAREMRWSNHTTHGPRAFLVARAIVLARR